MSGSEAGRGVVTGPVARPGRRASLVVALDGFALVWSIGLAVAVFSVPVSQQELVVRGTAGHEDRGTVTRFHPLAQIGGPGIVVFVVALVVLALVVTVVHVVGLRRGGGWTEGVGWAAAAISWAAVFLGAFTVGPYALPVAALLVGGCALFSAARPERSAVPAVRTPARPPRS